MYFAVERIEKAIEDLKSFIFSNKFTVDGVILKEGHFQNVDAVDRDSASWMEFHPDSRWGGRYQHAWFRSSIRIPDSYEGKTAVLYLSTDEAQGPETGTMAAYITGYEKRWDIMNPQFICYINGELQQGLDVNHREVLLDSACRAGNVYQIDLQTYGGMTDRKYGLYLELAVLEKEVQRLYYNMNLPLMVIKQLPEGDKKRTDMLSILNEATNILDFRKPFSEKFYGSIKTTDEFLERELYERLCGHEDVIATCIGHTHIDVAWLWTVAQTREKTARSFSTVVKLMEEYPEYMFMSSQPQLYEFIKEDRPELFDIIKERVKEGRWEPEGAMWLEADCNIASGESLVRQILFGTGFFKDEFGVTNTVLWLPDVFGYSAALPQILKKSGISYFMTSKISWNQFNKLPYDTFMWKGIDGTEILSYFLTTRPPSYSEGSFYTTYNGTILPASIMGGWERFQQKDINNDILIAFGYGDGGGGPTREMLENCRRLGRGIPGCPRTRMGKVSEFFERLEAKVKGNRHLPKWVGELYLENHQGTYTSMGRNKKYNRRSEQLLQNAEFLSSFAMCFDYEYPKAALDKAWKTVLLNQFHDILPGTAIKEVYEVSREQYENVLERGGDICRDSMEFITRNVRIDKNTLAVFNTLSFKRNDIAVFDVPQEIGLPCVSDEKGEVSPCQVFYENGRRKALFFAKGIPPKGYKTYEIREESGYSETSLVITASRLENNYFIVELDEKGTISELYDKKVHRRVLRSGMRGNQLQAFEDKPRRWDNWNIEMYFEEKMWEVDSVESVEVLENGPVRGGVRIRKKFMDSTIVQDIFLYRELPRIDFKTVIDWKEDQILLKAAFPVDINSSRASYEIQFGSVERQTHSNTSWESAQYEVCGHKWADLSEDGYGVSLLNDCKYGYDIKDGNMRLTLLKSGIAPYREIDREKHEFTYSLYPHAGRWQDAETVKLAYYLNIPLCTCVEKPHSGSLPPSMSMIGTDCDNVIIDTVKRAEDGSGLVIRLYEACNRRTAAEITFYKPLSKVIECDLMENGLKEVCTNEGQFAAELLPYEIKTYKLFL